ncbi:MULTISPECIES: hypothetical protein [Lactococcus]|uniref:Uncharacterized protein n=1 Tax=Lactococcus garvieae TaxID=1363 RepID=A0AA43PH40_9LACT|nr:MULTISPECIES: hypothetical protein [Lactococcus]MDH7960194.1 hypothetical protein [Lactococcus garvieae]USI66320.1 hypothetical protein LMK05_03355 [Lactococcus petauri]WJE13477.1 hypothetical protein QR692_03500 [Lactococcus petauri]BDM75698.1 hypothetical protein LGMS210922A_06430 [Lactococcus garvieae]BDW50967.1 hypothetical protein LG21E68_06420 [Lactococcus garvieae]
MIIFVIVIALGAIFFIPMIDLSNNMDLLRREYNTMTHKELDNIYVNSNSNIFSVDTNFREQVGIDIQKKRFFSSTFNGYILVNGFKEPSYRLVNTINLNKIIDIELREDNDIVTKVSTASVVARGVVGGMLAGGIGTIVGGATAKSKSSSSLKEISIRFKLSDRNNPYQEILVAFNKNGISKEKQQEVYRLFSQLELVISDIKV